MSLPFHILNLHEEHGATVEIDPVVYDQIIVPHQPDARLVYMDEDDGEVITV